MIITTLTLAAGIAGAQPATVPTVPATPATAPARTLASLPGVTVKYYEVAGRTAPAIEKNLKSMMANPAMRDTMRLYNWNFNAQVSKRTQGTTCSVVSVKAKQTSFVNLPRLTEQAKVKADVMTAWNGYVTALENEATANVWFISDRLPAIERSLANLPCDKVGPAWTAALERLKAQQLELAKQQASAAAAAAAARAAKNKGAASEVTTSDD